MPRRFALFAAVATLAMPACSSRSHPPAPAAAEPLPVAVATIAASEVADAFEAGGVVQARTTATLTARIAAPVREVRAAPGDRVRGGQVLIVLDGRDLGAHARSARSTAEAAGRGAAAAAADKDAAEATLVLARTTHERISGLHARRSATAQELDAATAALRTAESHAAGATARAHAAASGVESAQAASEAAVTTESYALITAPFAGVVVEKMVEPGNMASPGLPLLRLEDTAGFRLEVRVDESRINEIAMGARVGVAIDALTGPAEARSHTTGSAGPPASRAPGSQDGSVVGTVSEIGRSVDADARAFLVKIALPDVAGLRSGVFGRARFSTHSRRALTVPAAAIVHHGQLTTTFVVEQGVARVRLVNVQGSEVLAGLAEGDVVVTAPPAALTDGRRVTVGGK